MRACKYYCFELEYPRKNTSMIEGEKRKLYKIVKIPNIVTKKAKICLNLARFVNNGSTSDCDENTLGC